MKFIVTNDDGIDADGISILARVAREFGDVTLIAPKHHLSGCSHQMTFEGHLDAGQRDDGRWWIDGYPADCVRIGVSRICPDVDVVLSGVNHGSNLGLDNYLSGTVAAAREATFFGVPSIAFSQYHRGIDQQVWNIAETLVRRTLERLLKDHLGNGCYWNVNFPVMEGKDPGLVEFQEAPLCLSPLPNDYQRDESGFNYIGDYHARENIAGTDVAACHAGYISLTQVQSGNTHRIRSDSQVEKA